MEEFNDERIEYNWDTNSMKTIIEAIMFSTESSISIKDLKKIFQDVTVVKDADIQAALNELMEEYKSMNRAFHLVEIADKYQFCSKPEYGEWIRKFYKMELSPEKLSQPSIETLAIIAYRQPVTKIEIEDIRGVSVDYALKKLLDFGLVKITGRKDILGHPFLYATTEKFLESFGLKNLGELPQREELILQSVEKSFHKKAKKKMDFVNKAASIELNSQDKNECYIEESNEETIKDNFQTNESDLESKDNQSNNQDE